MSVYWSVGSAEATAAVVVVGPSRMALAPPMPFIASAGAAAPSTGTVAPGMMFIAPSRSCCEFHHCSWNAARIRSE